MLKSLQKYVIFLIVLVIASIGIINQGQNTLNYAIIQEQKSYVVKGRNKEDLFAVLHVGPKHMGTSTIQRVIAEDYRELRRDNVCVYESEILDTIGKENIQKLNKFRDPVALATLTSLKAQESTTMKAMISYLDYCYRDHQNLLLSTEHLDIIKEEIWENAFLKPVLNKWDITVAVFYKRFYYWVPSLWIDIMEERAKDREWPKNGPEEDLIPFHEWYHNEEAYNLMRLQYTDNYMDHWQELAGVNDVVVYNLHEPNVARSLYCSTLKASSACSKHINDPVDQSEYVSNIDKQRLVRESDRLACELYFEGSIKVFRTSRQEAGRQILNFFSEQGIIWSDLPLSCMAENDLDDVLMMSRQLEMQLLPEFYEKNVMVEDFEIQKFNFCDVDVKKTLKIYGNELRDLF